MSGLSRRRFLLVAAGAAAMGGVGGGWPEPAKGRVSWQGVAMGAKAQILVDHADRAAAEECLVACRQEIDRLESLFSLYRAESAVSRLNATGRLDAPDADMLRLLSLAASVHTASGGVFDPTVQPLWAAYARLYNGASDEAGVELDLPGALARTGLQYVRYDARRIAFAKPGMALTFNGIAQGYITDRIAGLLRARGYAHVLVNLGEIRAVGSQSDGEAWPVAIAGGNRIVSLRDGAIATSAALGTTFDEAGRVGHIIDPHSGDPMAQRRQVTVTAPNAALADALSTALCAAPDDAATDLLRFFPQAGLVTAPA